MITVIQIRIKHPKEKTKIIETNILINKSMLEFYRIGLQRIHKRVIQFTIEEK